MSHLEAWNQFKQPPKTALKTIGAGRLRGKSDINPQWRYQAMTEVYGPCGIGWCFSIVRTWTVPGHGAEVFAFAEVSLQIKNGDEWSQPIPGLGGHKLVIQEDKGVHNNDEGFKMAVTDALGTAMKMLGVAADVYLGNFDGSKYATTDQPATRQGSKNSIGGDKPPAQTATLPPPSQPFSWSRSTSAQRRDYVMAKIEEARQFADPVQAKDKLTKLSEGLAAKGQDFTAEDLSAVVQRLADAEQSLLQECSGD